MKKNRKLLVITFICLTFLTAFLLPSNNIKNQLSSSNIADNDANEEENELLIKISDKIITMAQNLSMTWKEISNTSAGNSQFPVIANDSQNNVHIVWQEDIDGDDDILHVMFNYTTKTFGQITNISDIGGYTGVDSRSPDMNIDSSDNIHVVWVEANGGNDIHYRKYNSQTSTWNASLIRVAHHTTRSEVNPSISSNSTGGIAIAFQTGIAAPIFNKKLNISFFDGVTTNWTHASLYPTDNGCDEEMPEIICDNDIWYLAYRNFTASSQYHLDYHTQSVWGVWSNKITVRDSGVALLHYPELKIKNDKIFLTWQENSGNLRVYSKNKTIAGSWQGPSVYNDLSGDTGATDSWQIYGTDLDSNGELFLTFQNASGIGYKKYGASLEYQGFLITPDTNDHAPCVTLNELGSPYFAWQDGATPEIFMRKLDTFGPQLVVYNLNNDTSFNCILNLNSSVYMNDISIINYSRYEDTDNNGIDDDGNDWIEIHSWQDGDSLNQFNFTWDTNATGNRLDIRHFLLSVKAIDKNGLDEGYIFGNLTIDNYKPQTSKLINIYDNFGHSYLLGDTNFTYNDGGSIHFVFEAHDNNSRDKTVVELYNNVTGFLKANSSAVEIVISQADGLLVGTGFYDFTIKVNDKINNFNISNTITRIRIDNDLPDIQLTGINNDDEITDGYVLNLLSTSNDNLYANYSYYNQSTPGIIKQLGHVKKPTGAWTFTINLPEIIYDSITFIVNITDYAYLNSSITIDLRMDNLEASPELVDPLIKVGYSPNLNVTFVNNYTENDVVKVSVSVREHGTGSYFLVQTIFLNDGNRTLNNNGTHYFVYFDQIDFETVPDFFDWAGAGLDLKINTTDNQGLIGERRYGEATGGIEIVTGAPDAPKSFGAVSNKANNVYTITLTWTNVTHATVYLIYRSFSEFKVDSLNVKSPSTLWYYMGSQPGESYCIAKFNESGKTYVDTVYGPNTYYYAIIATNSSNNPSDVLALGLNIAPEEANIGIQGNITEIWIYFFIAYIGAMVVITVYGLKRIKKTFTKGRVKLHVEKIEVEVAAKFDSADIDLDARAAKEVHFISPTSKKVGRWAPATASIMDEKAASFDEADLPEATGAIDKCPTCGWILSSTANKCPRCGWIRL